MQFDAVVCHWLVQSSITAGPLTYSFLWCCLYCQRALLLADACCKRAAGQIPACLTVHVRLGPTTTPSDLTLQVLHFEGVVAGSRAAVTLGNTTICKELSVCIRYWHSQPARDKPNQSRTSRVQGLQGPWTEISRIRQTCATAVRTIGSTLVAFTYRRLSERLLCAA